MIPGTIFIEKKGAIMKSFYMGIDVSKGYADAPPQPVSMAVIVSIDNQK